MTDYESLGDFAPRESENPYQAPTAYASRADVREAAEESLGVDHIRRVAIYQKGVLIAVGVYLAQLAFRAVCWGADWEPPFMVLGAVELITLVAYIGGVVAIGLLAARLYNAFAGVVLALLTFVPCLNLLIILIINHKANDLLDSNGITVGFFGARMSDFREMNEEQVQ